MPQGLVRSYRRSAEQLDELTIARAIPNGGVIHGGRPCLGAVWERQASDVSPAQAALQRTARPVPGCLAHHDNGPRLQNLQLLAKVGLGTMLIHGPRGSVEVRVIERRALDGLEAGDRLIRLDNLFGRPRMGRKLSSCQVPKHRIGISRTP